MDRAPAAGARGRVHEPRTGHALLRHVERQREEDRRRGFRRGLDPRVRPQQALRRLRHRFSGDGRLERGERDHGQQERAAAQVLEREAARAPEQQRRRGDLPERGERAPRGHPTLRLRARAGGVERERRADAERALRRHGRHGEQGRHRLPPALLRLLGLLRLRAPRRAPGQRRGAQRQRGHHHGSRRLRRGHGGPGTAVAIRGGQAQQDYGPRVRLLPRGPQLPRVRGGGHRGGVLEVHGGDRHAVPAEPRSAEH
mmetsp:Transcript_3072/g.8690  ORF Transcript_3072/g.8690 Transcript_3072/m.8690 type:complete len:256 (-) Transcript_3072:1665-2432(-)